MKNKVELKKTVIICILVILTFTTIFAVLNCYQYWQYTTNYNKKINKIIGTILQKYPNVSQEELIEVINGNSNAKDFFMKYGINIEEEAVIAENNSFFIKFEIINVSIILITSTTIMVIILIYNNKKNREIDKITKYINEISNENYKLDIEENTEDELSILKNEIYKITVMLKEQAENSKNDKIKFKNSLSDISHQLKTPLTSILIMIDNMLENTNMDEETRTEFIKDIKRKILNINFLVQELLKLSKLESGTIQFTDKDVKVVDILNKVIENVSVLSDLRDINIILQGNKESIIHCDMKWQVEALTNIVKNAVEYSYCGTSIDITVEENKIYSQIKIRDYGKGIKEKELKHIFERFYKASNSSKDSIGIGLALAKIIIEKDNGQIVVESVENKGTTFTVRYFKN